jgi:S-adenosylmethionine-diacylglycerol 3-amino-3-carboxypropyl transferase
VLFDRTFEAAFRRLFVYNILFEDAEVDGRYLGLDETSRVLGISAAGCGLASMVRFHPQHIDAVDINGHHLALAALKMSASKELKSFGLLYDLFGYGRVTQPQDTVRRLTEGLPVWMQKYWKRHYHRFDRSLYQQGLTAWMLGQLRQRVGLGTEWMHNFVHLDRLERIKTIRSLAEPVLRKPWMQSVLNSPIQQLALGVNFSQRDRMLSDGIGTVADFVLGHLERVAGTDVETNWFAWYAAAGHYNHANANAVPPYLRKASHLSSSEAKTDFAFHHKSIFDVLEAGHSNTWTHYSLCDAMDWMPQPVQTKLLQEIVRTARPGARVLLRSVEDRNIVDDCGWSSKLRHLEGESRNASLEDRSCQYKRVDFFEVTA